MKQKKKFTTELLLVVVIVDSPVPFSGFYILKLLMQFSSSYISGLVLFKHPSFLKIKEEEEEEDPPPHWHSICYWCRRRCRSGTFRWGKMRYKLQGGGG